VIEPGDPVERLEFDCLEVPPRAAAADHLCLVEPMSAVMEVEESLGSSKEATNPVPSRNMHALGRQPVILSSRRAVAITAPFCVTEESD
jgi:hypothetical protein